MQDKHLKASEIKWDLIETVLLDMDGTLLDLHFDNYFWLEYLPKVYGETFDIEHDEAVSHLHQRFKKEQGTMAWYCLDYWSEQLQLDILGLKRDVESKIAVRPHVEEFLSKLKKQGKKIFLVTNAHRDSLELKMHHTQLESYFDELISSHDYGEPKENLGLWESLVADYHFDRNTTLLIDDTETVLAAAENFGIRYLLCIKQPDFQKPSRDNLKYPAIADFTEIMPL